MTAGHFYVLLIIVGIWLVACHIAAWRKREFRGLAGVYASVVGLAEVVFLLAPAPPLLHWTLAVVGGILTAAVGRWAYKTLFGS